jgi:hypothetical protein
MPPAVDPAVLEAYLNGLHPGPNANHMPISWNEPMGHAWNKTVIKLLTAEFKRNVRNCEYQLMLVLPENLDKNYIKNAITDKLAHHRSDLRGAMRKMTGASHHLTPAEIAASLAAEKREQLRTGRRNERRRNVSYLVLIACTRLLTVTQLYSRRDEIVQEALCSPWSKDPDLWNEIAAIFALFNENDMSSDETETEAAFGVSKELRRVRRHWISEPISKVSSCVLIMALH